MRESILVSKVNQPKEIESWFSAVAEGENYFIVSDGKDLVSGEKKVKDAIFCQFNGEICPYTFILL